MRNFILNGIFCLLILTSCAQKKVMTTKDEILIGYFTEKEFLKQTGWDQSSITPNADAIDKLSKLPKDYDVKIFLGTWCSDSKDWVPYFFEIRKNLPVKNIEVIAMDRTKKDTKGQSEEFKIHSVPTFVFLKNGKEIGRITETPQQTLEEDVLKFE